MSETTIALINNLPAILTAAGTLATTLIGIWITYKQSQTHSAVTELKAKYDANHPESPVQ